MRYKSANFVTYRAEIVNTYSTECALYVVLFFGFPKQKQKTKFFACFLEERQSIRHAISLFFRFRISEIAV